MESATGSLDLVTAPVLRKALKDAGVSGLSGAEKAELRPRGPSPRPT